MRKTPTEEALDSLKVIKRRMNRRSLLIVMMPIYVLIFPLLIIFHFNFFYHYSIDIVGFITLGFVFLYSFPSFMWRNYILKSHYAFAYKRFIIPEKIKPDFKFLKQWEFIKEIKNHNAIFRNREAIKKDILDEFSVQIISSQEHKLSMILFVILMGISINLFDKGMTLIAEYLFNRKEFSSIEKGEFFLLGAIVFLLFIGWSLAKDFLNKQSSKQKLRELREILIDIDKFDEFKSYLVENNNELCLETFIKDNFKQ